MAMNTKISSKYRDIVSECIQLDLGSPAIYQLKPEEEILGTLTRKTVGQKNQNMINKSILLVGETGAGKSTLINALLNYTMGVKLEDNIWFEIVEDEKKSQTMSQTSDVIVYEMLGFKDLVQPYSLTIIDTPGYGDTGGTVLDDRICERLLDLFRVKDGVHELNAVGLVMKASDNRLSDRLMYIFNSMTSLFGKELEEIIVVLTTNSNGLATENVLQLLEGAHIKCALNEKNEPVHFQFDNCQRTKRTEKNMPAIRHAWSVTEEGMKQFSEFLQNATPQELTKTSGVLNAIVNLTACIENLKHRIQYIEVKQKVTQETQDVLRRYEQEMKNNEKFVLEVPETYKVKEDIKGGLWGLLFYDGATVCEKCEENCHYPSCTVAWYPKDCEVMKGGNCTCTGKCSISDHLKVQWIYVPKTRKVKTTLEDMKKKFYKYKAESEREANVLKVLENEMKDLMAEKDQLVEESYQHVVTLEKIALNINSASTYVDFDFLIEKMKEEGDEMKVHKMEEMRKKMNQDKRLMAGLWYKLKTALY